MAKEVLLYGHINDESAISFINSLNESEGEDLVVRVNSEGGSPEYGWGMAAKFGEFSGKKTVKVDGQAYSMGLNFLLYADHSECLDVSKFLLHRAAYPEWVESSSMFTDGMKENLKSVNDQLQKAFANKVDVEKFETLTKRTLKEVFSMDSRVDVFFDAKVAKAIGLVSKVIPITPSKRAELMAIAANYKGEFKTEIIKKMDINELKNSHSSVYSEAVALGQAAEQDRVGAWMAFVDVDSTAVATGIASGKPLSQTAMAEFAKKAMSKNALAAIAADSAAAIETTEEVVEDKDKPAVKSAVQIATEAAIKSMKS